MDLQKRIFDPLARGESDSTRNVGLGLFIARAIVVAHGGSIRSHQPKRVGRPSRSRCPASSARAHELPAGRRLHKDDIASQYALRQDHVQTLIPVLTNRAPAWFTASRSVTAQPTFVSERCSP